MELQFLQKDGHRLAKATGIARANCVRGPSHDHMGRKTKDEQPSAIHVIARKAIHNQFMV